MKRLFNQLHSPTVRMTLGLLSIQSSILVVGFFCGLWPDVDGVHRHARGRMSETIAVTVSYLATKGEIDQLAVVLERLCERDPDLQSLGLVNAEGQLILGLKQHVNVWKPIANDRSAENQVQVPIYEGSRRFGTVQLCYRPHRYTGWLGFFWNDRTQLLVTCGGLGTLLYGYYNWRVVQSLTVPRSTPQSVRSAFDTLAEGLLVMDRTGQIVLANQAFASLQGTTPARLMQQMANSFDWRGDDDQPITGPLPWQKAIALVAPQSNTLLRLRDRDNNLRSFNVHASPVLGKGGAAIGVLASFDDITLLQQKQVELAASQQLAEQANRAKSEFLANMSHEIRTPMNAIIGFAEVLLRGYADDETQRRQYLSTIISSGRHLGNLINDILDLSKIESGRMQVELMDVRPHDIVLETMAVLNGRAEEKGLTLRYSTERPVPECIQSDPTRLRQIVTNLVGNAIKFTEAGGVTIHADWTESPIPQLTLAIRDTGIGISPESAANLFQPFVQADASMTRRYGGTGLGLVISKRFAEMLGGTIEISSVPQQGSTFTVTVHAPAASKTRRLDAVSAQQEFIAAQAPQVSAPLAGLQGANILVADDGEANRQLINVVLTRAGANVMQACNGSEAVAMAMQHSFDLILMDMQMPVLDGYSATSKLRAQQWANPIIALTGNAMQGDEEKCRAAGCTGYLSKPVDLTQLVATIRSHLAGLLQERTQNLSHEVASHESAPAPTPAPATSGPISSTLPTNDPEFRAIVVGFVKKLRAQLTHIRDCEQSQDWATLASQAHWLRGSAGTMGFAAFTEPAHRLQRLAEASDAAGARQALDEIEALLARVVLPAAPDSSTTPAQSLQPVHCPPTHSNLTST